MRTLVAALLLLFPLSSWASEGHGTFTKHKGGSFFMVTAEKHFSIEMELEGDTLKEGANKGEIVIHDANDKDVKGAKISITPWMPGMGHGVPDTPVITEKEGFFGSRYLLDNLVLTMGGHWEILVEVEKDGVKDGAVFDFPDVGGMGGHMAMKSKVKAPADLDLSATRSSEEGMFTAGYESTPAPPPMNTIHSWELTVKKASGEPVAGARIMVEGDMPEHGHGLPTSPEVTEEIGEGVYLVEGMKFSMPGWWTVSFHIKTGDHEDRVTFNLQLK